MIQEKKLASRFAGLWGAYLLLLCMMFCLLADMPVEAATSGDWEYEILKDGMVEIKGYNGKATEVVIPGKIDGKSVTSIGEGAFWGCSSLTSINIPNSVTNIKYSAFKNCASLTSIDIPNSVTNIENLAFWNCSSLTSINIPNSVTDIGYSAFMGCSSLTGINVVENSQSYVSKDGILYDKSCKTLICCPEGKQGAVTIPNSVTKIMDGAFNECSNLTSITIPSSVTRIGGYTFYDCSNLTSIEIPSSVTTIGTAAFYGCSSLTSIEIPSSVTTVEDGAFSDCSSLTSITIPSNMTTIGDNVFKGCSSLRDINVAKDSEAYASKDGILYNKAYKTLICCPGGKKGTIIVSSGVTAIEDGAFYGCSNLTSITIPSSVTTIGASAFSNCSSLTSITIPSSVTTIGTYAFYRCSSLTIYGESGSYAAKYAKENGIKFICLHHTYQPTTQKATTKKNGAIITKCSTCGDIKSTTTIYAASKIKLSKTSFTYNGKNQKPAVTIKDSKGKALSAKSYKVTYPKTSKNVGKYTVIITLKGSYSGTVKLTYQITPKGTSLSKLTAKKDGFTAKWKKQMGQTTGYQLQYSTSSKFKGAKTVTVKKNKTVSQSVKNLKAGKKYYVRIRTYKTVKINGKSVKLCSGWSKAKNVKTKK